jgi:hypothetical protein
LTRITRFASGQLGCLSGPACACKVEDLKDHRPRQAEADLGRPVAEILDTHIAGLVRPHLDRIQGIVVRANLGSGC